jgi:predicted esterase YcpF (UPF0227 family)
MKILYVHGFGSHYDPNHEKIQMLETLGTVIGVDVDYCKGFTPVFERVLDTVLAEGVDLIVGTSMGGYMAAHVGAETGTPFVALNPATEPSDSLQKWEGNFTDYNGNSHYLNENVIENYPEIVKEGCGLVLVESADEVISAFNTSELLDEVFEVHMIKGGSHRFTHMEQAVELIKDFMNRAETGYGTE